MASLEDLLAQYPIVGIVASQLTTVELFNLAFSLKSLWLVLDPPNRYFGLLQSLTRCQGRCNETDMAKISPCTKCSCNICDNCRYILPTIDMAKGTNLYEGYRSYFSRRLRYFCSAHTPLLSSPFDQSTDFLTSNATGQSNLARGSNDNNSIDESFRAAATNPLVANLVTPGTCDCLSLERRHCIYCFNKNFAQDDEGLKRRRKEIRKVINKIENPLRVKGYQVETEFVGYRGVCECGNKANKEGPVICNWCKKAASVEDQEVALQGGEYTLLGGRRWGRFSRN